VESSTTPRWTVILRRNAVETLVAPIGEPLLFCRRLIRPFIPRLLKRPFADTAPNRWIVPSSDWINFIRPAISTFCRIYSLNELATADIVSGVSPFVTSQTAGRIERHVVQLKDISTVEALSAHRASALRSSFGDLWDIHLRRSKT
jgi:hypothetical protein